MFSHTLGGHSLEVLYDVEGDTYRARGALIDTQALGVLGVRPILGRGISDADGTPEAPPTFLMTDRMWNERFGRDPGVMGRTFTMNGTPRTLIGILPPRFAMHNADVFFPTVMTGELKASMSGGPDAMPLAVWTYARLKPGVTPEQASANLQVIAGNLATLYPNRYPEGFRISIVSLADAYTATSLKEMVWILTGAVLMLLLIACSNVANLLLARATARESELALRASLGASRARLMQQVLAESIVLAVAGAAIGGLLAWGGLQWVRATIPAAALPAEMAILFSRQALVATIGVTVVTMLLCGLVPAVRAARGDLRARLMSTGKGTGLRGGHGRLRTLLVAVQVTLAVVLLVGAGLMMRTLISLQRIDPGVDTSNVLIGNFTFAQNRRLTPEQLTPFARQVVERVNALPGVIAASPSMGLPLQFAPSSPVAVIGTTPNETWRSLVEFVGDGYFRALGLPLVRGRLLSETDIDGARPVIVVNRRFVQEFFDDGDPIGRTVTFAAFGRGPGQPLPLFEIVGVVGDARNAGLGEDVRSQAFLPFTTPGVPVTALVVRTSVDPLSLQQSVRQQIWAVDRDAAFMSVTTLEEAIHRNALAAPAFGVGLMSTFAAVGLILAAIGVFSVTAYAVSLRTQEIGLRLALGAEPGGVMRMMLVSGLRPIVVGLVLGAGAAYGLSRVMANQIHGITATDPWTFAIVALVLLVVGVTACALPARRATKVDPLIAIRRE